MVYLLYQAKQISKKVYNIYWNHYKDEYGIHEFREQ